MKHAVLIVLLLAIPCLGQICEAPNGSSCWYFSPAAGSGGAGSYASPFLLGDLPSPTNCSVLGALTHVGVGDYVYFRGGTYVIPQITANCFSTAYIRPPVGGTASNPIVLKGYPGELPIFECPNCSQAIIGSADGQNGLPYVEIIGLTIDLSTSTPDLQVGGCIRMGVDGASQPGYVVAYNKCIGVEIDDQGGDNMDGIQIDGATGAWIHHNEVTGFQIKPGTGGNAYGLTLYTTQASIIEYNYIHNGGTNGANGIYDKNGNSGDPVITNGNTIRYNYVVNNTAGTGIVIFRVSNDNVSDNVTDGGIVSVPCNEDNFLHPEACTGLNVFNNLVIPPTWYTCSNNNGAALFAGGSDGISPSNTYGISIWNNIVLTACPTVVTAGFLWGRGYLANAVFPSVTRTSSTQLTIGANCSSGSPCSVPVLGTTYIYTARATVTVSAGFTAVCPTPIYIDTDGAIKVGSSADTGSPCTTSSPLVLSCSGCTVSTTNMWSYPDNIVLLAGWQVTNGAWASAGTTDIAGNTLAFVDYNLFEATSDSPPFWWRINYNGSPYSTPTMGYLQGLGFETHCGNAGGLKPCMDSRTNIFSDTRNYVVQAPYTTGGRYGDTLGPRVHVGAAFSDGIMNTAIYGPAAIIPLPPHPIQSDGSVIRGHFKGAELR